MFKSDLPILQVLRGRASPKAGVRAGCGNTLMTHLSKSSRMLHILLQHLGKTHCLWSSVVLSALRLRHQQSAYASLAEGCLSCTFPRISCVWAPVSKAACAQVVLSQGEMGFTTCWAA